MKETPITHTSFIPPADDLLLEFCKFEGDCLTWLCVGMPSVLSVMWSVVGWGRQPLPEGLRHATKHSGHMQRQCWVVCGMLPLLAVLAHTVVCVSVGLYNSRTKRCNSAQHGVGVDQQL